MIALGAAHLTAVIVVALINYPFVIAVDWYAKRSAVKKVYDLEVFEEQLRRERRNALLSTPVHALLLTAFILSRALRPAHDSVLTISTSFFLTLLWTEVWHYVSHAAMHTRLLHFLHREHHRSMVTNPWSSVSFSTGEKFIFSFGIIGFMSLLSQVIPVSVIGVAAYYVFYFYTNALGHSNLEFRPPNYYNSALGRIFNSPTFHAMHHARYTGNYGLLTPWLDQIFRTAWPDFPEVQTRAANGKPLLGLRESCGKP